jgi:hypothetical protein
MLSSNKVFEYASWACNSVATENSRGRVRASARHDELGWRVLIRTIA